MTARFALALLGIGTLALASAPAGAQSLFGQPLADPPAMQAPPGGAEGAPAPARRARPRGPTPARTLAITNASAMPLTALVIAGEGKTATLATPLAPGARTTLRLPTLRRCIVSVQASFGDEGEAEASDYDVCKEKSIRFTN